MSYRIRCSRSIPTFTLALTLTLVTAAGADVSDLRRSPDQGRVTVLLEALWQWLGLGAESPAAAAAPGTNTGTPTTDTGTAPGSGAGGEGTGTHDPNGNGDPPPEYVPDLNPGGG